MEQIWRTSVNEMISIYFESIVSLIPSMKKAKIRFNIIDAYDDWDSITTALYNAIVINSLNNSNHRFILNFPVFGGNATDFSNNSLIVLKETVCKDYLDVLINFDNIDTDIPYAIFCKIDRNNGLFISYNEIRYESINFVVFENYQSDSYIENFEVML